MFKKILHEPLLHFLLLGGLIFLLYGLQQNATPEVNPYRIEITAADLERLRVLWERKWQRPPTQDEFTSLIEQQIREEILYREALAMGLDQDDTIVRRRLAQKLEFISADLASQAEPGDQELADYLADNADKFAEPARISFLQLYINADQRGAKAETDALQLLEAIAKDLSDTELHTVGDRLMFGPQHQNVTEYEISRMFGQDFAGKLFKLPAGDWQGPVVSGYGLHLVRIDSKTPSRPAELAQVRDKVRKEWLSEQRRKADKAFYKALRQRYEIVVEAPDSAADELAGT